MATSHATLSYHNNMLCNCFSHVWYKELRSVLSTFVCGGSISYKQLPEVQYKGKSTPVWSLLEEFGWKKKAETKGADWTFKNTRLSLNNLLHIQLEQQDPETYAKFIKFPKCKFGSSCR